MAEILKYEVPNSAFFELELPEGAKFLSIKEMHGDEVYIFFLLNESSERLTKRKFIVVDTGNLIKERVSLLSFFGSFSRGSAYVGHVFEKFE